MRKCPQENRENEKSAFEVFDGTRQKERERGSETERQSIREISLLLIEPMISF